MTFFLGQTKDNKRKQRNKDKKARQKRRTKTGWPKTR